MVVSPPYVKPSNEGLYQHYKALNDQQIPFIMYHHPGRTGCNPPLHTLEKILQLPYCTGLKDASGSCTLMTSLASSYTIYSGDDALILPHLSLGACGLISVASNLIPHELKQIMSVFAQNPQEALSLFLHKKKLLEVIFFRTQPHRD